MIIKILVSSQIHSLFILVTTLQRDLFTNIIFYHKNKINKYIYIYIYIIYDLYRNLFTNLLYRIKLTTETKLTCRNALFGKDGG